MKVKRPSIGDVARRAGVSTATVSRVINAPEAVAEATRRRVAEAIDALHYVQSATARNFKAQRSEAVLVIAADIGNIYYSELFRGIQLRAEASGYSVIITSSNTNDPQDLIFSHLRTAKVDGVIILSGYELSEGDLSLLEQIYGGPPPIVALGELRGHLRVPHILADNEAGGYMATRHLIDMGHRRIGHVTAPPGLPVRTARRQGFERAMAEAGLPVASEHVLEGGFNAIHGRNAARQVASLRDRPTALFCANDEMMMGLISELSGHGITVPDDLSVIGFDNITLADTYLPALSTVNQPRETMGRGAMELLLDIIGRRPLPPGNIIEIPLELMPRHSVADLREGAAALQRTG